MTLPGIELLTIPADQKRLLRNVKRHYIRPPTLIAREKKASAFSMQLPGSRGCGVPIAQYALSAAAKCYLNVVYGQRMVGGGIILVVMPGNIKVSACSNRGD